MKNLILELYKLINTINILLIFRLKKSTYYKPILFLNGAVSGSGAGPKVKVKRLKYLFKTSRICPNIFYCLSNCIYSYNYFINKFVKLKVPIIYNQNGIFYKNWFKGNVSIENKKMEFYLKNADYVFYQSKFCKSCCDNHIYKRKRDYKILYNAVNTDEFIPGKKIETDYVPVLKIGTYNEKNSWRIFDIIETIRIINHNSNLQFKVSVVGYVDKILKSRAQELINKYKMNDQIYFYGKISHEKIVKIMQQHLIFLTTKLNDPCSNAIIEAMSCGLPVIFHNSGGNFELVRNAGWGFGKKEHEIEEISYNKNDLLLTLKKITRKEIYIKSNLARSRAQKYFNISKWEKEHIKVFKSSFAKLKNKV